MTRRRPSRWRGTCGWSDWIPDRVAERPPRASPEERRDNKAVWLLGHDIDELALFARVESDEELRDRCAYCGGPIDVNEVPGWGSVGVACPEPEGIGPFDYGQLVWVELGERLLLGEIVVFPDEPELQTPGQWDVNLPACSMPCNLLIRALARADVACELGRPLDEMFGDIEPRRHSFERPPASGPATSVIEGAAEVGIDLVAVHEQIENWTESCLREKLLRCGWCAGPLTIGSIEVVGVGVDGDDTRWRRPRVTAVRVAHRLVPAVRASHGDAPEPWLHVLLCGPTCCDAVRHAVEAGRHRRGQ